MLSFVVLGAVLLAHLDPAAAQGKFTGELVGLLEDNGRDITLTKTFGYVDSKGQAWDVPAGAKTDGASVPSVFWQLYAPFTGKWRKAAVIHDYYCVVQTRSWQETHGVFYEAMLAAGVEKGTATVMWAAVYNFGPRWGTGVKKRALPATVEEQKQFLSDLQRWVETTEPSREQIAKAIDDGRVPKF